MFDSLKEFWERIDVAQLRVRRPGHVVFLCGGVIDKDLNSNVALSVRDYLFRIKNIQRHLSAKIVLAETAQQLYRDTSYEDLISFEEDIAKLSSIVLVISESAGSLAELGAFASEVEIRETLRIIISEENSSAESFVRYGPVRRIENINRNRIGIFPWRYSSGNGRLIKSSLNIHYPEIRDFIEGCVKDIPSAFLYRNIGNADVFYTILWVLSLLDAVPPAPLYDAVRIVHPNYSDEDLRNKLYVLKTCGWVRSFSYANRDFYFLSENIDPYEYAFIKDKRVRNIPDLKVRIVKEFREKADISKAVSKRLVEKRAEL